MRVLLAGVAFAVAAAVPADADSRLTTGTARHALRQYAAAGEQIDRVRCRPLRSAKLACHVRMRVDIWITEDGERTPGVAYGPAGFHVRCRRGRAEVYDFAFERWSRPLTRC